MNNISRNSYCWFRNHNIHLTTNPLKASRTGPPFTIGNSCGWHEFTQKQYYSIFNIRCQGWLASVEQSNTAPRENILTDRQRGWMIWVPPLWCVMIAGMFVICARTTNRHFPIQMKCKQALFEAPATTARCEEFRKCAFIQSGTMPQLRKLTGMTR